MSESALLMRIKAKNNGKEKQSIHRHKFRRLYRR